MHGPRCNEAGWISRSMIVCSLVLLCLAGQRTLADQPATGNWPGWRGDGSGVSRETHLPVAWDITSAKQLAWKTPITGNGNSSPILWNGRIFLTTSLEKGTLRQVVCLDAKNGAILWQKSFTVDHPAITYEKNQYASSTPVTDGQRLYVFFDDPGLVALSMDGKVLWTRPLGPFKNIWGLASSPVLYHDLVILCCDQDQGSFITAVDRNTGEVRWQTPRKSGRGYATPVVITVNGKAQVVVNDQLIVAYDPETGREIWTCKGMTDMVVPSIVTDQHLVYATSGRNGPTLAIDPSGTGDISETHVKMQRSVGGPYVPSPVLLQSLLLLPSDDGALRGVDANGDVIVEARVADHFTSSPVLADGKIYWASERGHCYVFDATKVHDAKPSLPLLAVNNVNDPCLASPVIAAGKLYLRTTTQLLCVSGTGGATPIITSQATVASLDELNARYAQHQAGEGEDVAIRLEIVDALSQSADVQAVAFLEKIALTDNHWDVSEAAAKALGVIGRSAIPSMMTLLTKSPDYQNYLKVIAADNLGSLCALDAVPALVSATTNRDRLVRAAALRDLADIAHVHATIHAEVVAALLKGLQDPESMVKEAALAGLVQVGDSQPTTLDAVTKLTTDTNPLIVEKARKALAVLTQQQARAALEKTWYGEARATPSVAQLHAGPISLKFENGELRYLCVGRKEIIRRVYFAVRDSRWDTVMPIIEHVDIVNERDQFHITLQAVCTNDIADYRWQGEIIGTPDGKITMRVHGEPNTDFQSWRIGVCVLYGTDSLAGQSYKVFDTTGQATVNLFPHDVAPKSLAENFRTLQYTTADGLQVRTALRDGAFSMEDQRNFGDSSYKAYSALPYNYPKITKGTQLAQELTIDVTAPHPTLGTNDVKTRITVGKAIQGTQMPRFTLAPKPEGAPSFVSINQNRHPEAADIAWEYNPAAHLPDDDTHFENLPAIVDQARTLRSFAPQAKLHLAGLTLDSPYPRPGRDPRNNGLFAAAWTMSAVKYLAVAGVADVSIDAGQLYAPLIMQSLAPAAGRPLLGVDIATSYPAPVTAFAVQGTPGTTLWVVNTTAHTQPVTILGMGAKLTLQRLTVLPTGEGKILESTVQGKNGEVAIELGPFEVWQLVTAK